MSVLERHQLLEIANDSDLKTAFKATTLPVFLLNPLQNTQKMVNTALLAVEAVEAVIFLL